MKLRDILNEARVKNGSIQIERDDIENGMFVHDFSEQFVPENFWCNQVNLTTLERGPKEVGNNMAITSNPLTSLEHAPMKIEDGYFTFDNCPVKSLHGIGKTYLKEVGGYIFARNIEIPTNLLGLLLVKSLHGISFFDRPSWNTSALNEEEAKQKELQDILTQHIRAERNILDCKEELMQNPKYREYAKL